MQQINNNFTTYFLINLLVISIIPLFTILSGNEIQNIPLYYFGISPLLIVGDVFYTINHLKKFDLSYYQNRFIFPTIIAGIIMGLIISIVFGLFTILFVGLGVTSIKIFLIILFFMENFMIFLLGKYYIQSHGGK